MIKVPLANLMTLPWIGDRVATGWLTLHGARSAIQSGLLTMLRPDSGFAPVATDRDAHEVSAGNLT